jgi:hypothetical protein
MGATVTRTPLHTSYRTISRYHEIAADLLDSLRVDADNLLESNDDEHGSYPADTGQHLADRLAIESWVEHTTQQLRDVLYLLAVGDNGPTAAAEADPEQASKQAHADRRRKALERLAEQGLTV